MAGPLGSTGWSTAAHVHVQYTQFPDPWVHSPGGTIDPWPIIQGIISGGAAAGQEDTMKVGIVPGGTIALLGEFVARPFSGGEEDAYNTAIETFGSTAVSSEAKMSILIQEANARRAALVADIAAQVKAASVDVDALAAALAPKLGLDPAQIVAAFGSIDVDGSLTSDGLLTATARIRPA